MDTVLAGLYELIAPHLTEKQRRLLAGAHQWAVAPDGLRRVRGTASGSSR